MDNESGRAVAGREDETPGASEAGREEIDPETGLPAEYADYDLGSFQDAMVSSDAERVVLTEDPDVAESEGRSPRAWWFDFTDISWFRTNQIMSDCIEQTAGGGGKVQMERYYREVAEAKTDDWSLADEENATLSTFLTGLSSHLGAQLEGHLPDPGGVDLDEGEEENSDERSETSARRTQ